MPYFKGITEGRINIRFAASNWKLVGQFLDLKITGSSGLSLEGQMAPISISALVVE